MTIAGQTFTVNQAAAAAPPSAGPWAESFGGTGSDMGYAVAVDAAGNIYVAGTFSGSFTFGTTPLTSAGGVDIFLAKLSSSGTLQWVHSFGSTGNEMPKKILVDSTGNIYLCGSFSGTGSFGGTSTTATGSSDGFIAKYSSSGSFAWSRTIDATSAAQVNGIALDAAQQNLVAIGMFAGTATFTSSSTFSSVNGGDDSFLAKYSVVDGSPIWAKTWGSLDYDTGLAVFCDANNNILVVGCFAYQLNFGLGVIASYAGTRDIYVAKFAASGSVAPGTALWSKSYGSLNNTTPYCAGLDANGDLTVGGTFVSQTDLGSGTITGGGSYSAFLAKYSGATGTNLWNRVISSSWSAVPYGIGFDTQNNPIICGNYQGTCNFGAETSTDAGSGDVFVAKYSGTSGSPVWAESVGGTGTDNGWAIAVDKANYSTAVGYFSGSANFGVPLNSAGGYDIFVLRVGP
jgi:hypothetical protein